MCLCVEGLRIEQSSAKITDVLINPQFKFLFVSNNLVLVGDKMTFVSGYVCQQVPCSCKLQ